MRQMGVVVVLGLAACAAKTGIAVSEPMAPPSEFAHIKRFRIRAITADALWANSPEQLAQPYPTRPEVSQYHETALNTARRVLEEKGYEVTVDWENPYVYGSDRPCIGPKPGDHQCTMDEVDAHACKPAPWYTKCAQEYPDDYHGYFIRMASFGGNLAPDEAFLELVTFSDVENWTSTYTTSGEQEVGRVTDADGNTTGRIYENTSQTHTRDHRDEFSSATVQIFVASRRKPLYDAQAWSKKSANLVYTTQDVLANIPPRVK